MVVKEISLKELDALFIDTLERGSMKLLQENDEEIEYQLFEEFDLGVHSFLHIDSLEKLEEAGFINEEIKTLSLELRELSRQLLDSEMIRNPNTVKTNKDWHKVLELSDRIRELKTNFDKNMIVP
jgi:hypothetical protein